MRLLHDIAVGLWWVGVIGGGLAFLAWVGDRLQARDGERSPDPLDSP